MTRTRDPAVPADARESNGQIVRRWVRRVLPWMLLATAAYLLYQEVQRRSLVESGQLAPDLVATAADGSSFVLAEHRGQVVVATFWATWCEPCRAETPVLSRAHARLGDRGLVVGLGLDPGDLARVEEIGRSWGMTFPIARPSDEVVTAWRVSQVPTTYVIDARGRVIASFMGVVDEARLDTALDQALGR